VVHGMRCPARLAAGRGVDRADPLDLIGQCPAAGLLAGVLAEREVEPRELQVDRVDHL